MSETPAIKLKATYSTASAKSVAEFLAKTYALPKPLECSLYRRGFNDSFDVTDADGHRYILRVSCRRARGDADVASETEFLRYLDAAGIPVAVAVPARDGRLFSFAQMAEGRRPIVLFHYIEGREVKWEAPGDSRLQGTTLARIHNAAEQYAGRDHCRYRLDLDHLLHRPLNAILGIKGLPEDSRTGLSALAARLAAAVLAIDHLSWTRCHGDCHGQNARVAETGKYSGQAVFFDFDDGGPGYLAYDLAVNLWSRTFFNRKLHAQWHEFVQGYTSVRPIRGADFEAVHLFAAIRHIWLLGEYAGRASDWGSAAVSDVWVQGLIQDLQTWENEKLVPALF